jgi:polyisoprenoid-binding protein YceI
MIRHAVISICFLGAGLTGAASSGQADESWMIEEGSAIRFTAKQQNAPVEGGFEDFSADITFDPGALDASSIAVTIAVESVTTGHKDRDATLRSAAFFDAETWPEARFSSSSIAALGDGRYEAAGELTIRDVTKPVTLPFTLEITPDPENAGRLHATGGGEVAISRLDYGVGQGEWASTATVADEVVIAIEIEASKAE